ncbi:histidine phosphotransferase family protein [Roseomonas elaeocarpi]|uniref:Histidine phosphotransferase family protein n=1 Tax=Roseomonas elaeocarpi TaxID=907779 RepID=A0ABV6JU97_9PROT
MNCDLALTQDLCARLCHDLGGPLGGVTGALDLIDQTPEAVEVAREGMEALNWRLRLWRAVAGAGAGPMGRAEILQLLDGAHAGGRTRIDGTALAEAELPADAARAVLAAAMLGAEALPRGGTVHLSGGPDGVRVRPEGRNAAWTEALAQEDAVAGRSSGPRGVLLPLLLCLAEAAGWRVLRPAPVPEGLDALVLRAA